LSLNRCISSAAHTPPWSIKYQLIIRFLLLTNLHSQVVKSHRRSNSSYWNRYVSLLSKFSIIFIPCSLCLGHCTKANQFWELTFAWSVILWGTSQIIGVMTFCTGFSSSFAEKRRSLGRYNSLADSDHGVFFFFSSWISIWFRTAHSQRRDSQIYRTKKFRTSGVNRESKTCLTWLIIRLFQCIVRGN
jgi:hypothetical protein